MSRSWEDYDGPPAGWKPAPIEAITEEDVEAATGFTQGPEFKDEAEVRAFFTPDTQHELWGRYAVTDLWELDRIIRATLLNHWHME